MNTLTGPGTSRDGWVGGGQLWGELTDTPPRMVLHSTTLKEFVYCNELTNRNAPQLDYGNHSNTYPGPSSMQPSDLMKS